MRIKPPMAKIFRPTSLALLLVPLLGASTRDSQSVVTVTIDVVHPGHAISDLVYGVNDGATQARRTTLAYPIVRLGGNTSTRYNWQKNAWNTGKDWYFLNIPLPYAPPLSGQVEPLSFSDRLLVAQADGGNATLLTIPTIGWVAKERQPAWGYSVLKYGKQKATETDQSHGDAGNGELPGGKPLMTGNPADTSVAATPELMAAWVRHNRALNLSRQGQPLFYAMDNEPALWHITHQDLRYGDRKLAQPQAGFDEIWARTVAYAGAVKAADPTAKVLGPVEWGWCGYFGAGRDGCRPGADRHAHDGLPFLQWYLRQVCNHLKRTGVRLVDDLDVHYYPASDNDALDESPAAQQRRLAATRALYDPDFRDGSWIEEPVRLIPRLRAWVDSECPGTGLAITEYHFGEQADGIAAALANAEALAIFGREGLSLATYYGVLVKDSLLEAAFRLYLDYDGLGASALGGYTLQVHSSAPLEVPVYALKSGAKILVYAFNKGTESRSLDLSRVAGYRLSRRFTLTQQGGLAPNLDRSLQRILPPRSIDLSEWTQTP